MNNCDVKFLGFIAGSFRVSLFIDLGNCSGCFRLRPLGDQSADLFISDVIYVPASVVTYYVYMCIAYVCAFKLIVKVYIYC